MSVPRRGARAASSPRLNASALTVASAPGPLNGREKSAPQRDGGGRRRRARPSSPFFCADGSAKTKRGLGSQFCAENGPAECRFLSGESSKRRRRNIIRLCRGRGKELACQNGLPAAAFLLQTVNLFSTVLLDGSDPVNEIRVIVRVGMPAADVALADVAACVGSVVAVGGIAVGGIAAAGTAAATAATAAGVVGVVGVVCVAARLPPVAAEALCTRQLELGDQ